MDGKIGSDSRSDDRPTGDAPVIGMARPIVAGAKGGVFQGPFASPDTMLLPDLTRRAALTDVVVGIAAILLMEMASATLLQEALIPRARQLIHHPAEFDKPIVAGDGARVNGEGDIPQSPTTHDAVFGKPRSFEEWAQDQPVARDLHRAIVLYGIATRALAAAGVLWVIARLRRQRLRSLGLTRGRWIVDVPLGLVTPAALGFLMMAINFLLALLFPELLERLSENSDRLVTMLPRLRPLGFVLLMVLVGFYEELLFRGFLMLRFRRALNGWTWAVILSTILFVLPHAAEQSWAAMIPITLLSLTFSLLTIWRRSLVPAMIAHALFNLGVVALLYVQAGEAWT